MSLANILSDGWQLEDGEERHRESPETFYIPPEDVRRSLAVDQIVKLMFRVALNDEHGENTEQVERMWVIVQRPLTDGEYWGVLDNDPKCTSAIQAGMQVIFEPRHVIQVYENAA